MKLVETFPSSMSLGRPISHFRRTICSSSILKARRSTKPTPLPFPHNTFRGEDTDLEAGTFHFDVERSSFTDNDLPRRLRLTSDVNVKSLILGSNLFNFVAADWDELPADLQAALQYVVRLPTLEELTILNVKNLPVSLLSAASFSTLSIHHAKFRRSKFRDRKNTPSNIVTRLKSFNFGLTPLSSIRALVRDRIPTDSLSIDLSSLHSLTVHNADEVAAFEEVMKVSPNLSILHCEVKIEVPSSLAACRSLKTLVLLFGIRDELQDPLLGLPDVLSEMSGDNVLEELLINVHVPDHHSCRTDAMWGRLDDILSQSAFHSLRRVSLKIIVWVDDDLGLSAEELEEKRRREALKEELEKIRASQFTWLSSHVRFEFSHRSEGIMLVAIFPHESNRRGVTTDLEAGTLHFDVERSSFTDSDFPRRLRLASTVNVKSLILSSKLFNFVAADWDELPTELQAALQHVIRLPTLGELTILKFKNLPATCLSAARFSTLSLRQAKFRRSKFHERKNTPSNIITRIKSFGFGLTPLSSIRALVRDRTSTNSLAIDFSSLHSLTSIGLCHADEVAACKEEMKVSPNLKYLQCEVDRKVPLSLAACRSLKTLVPLLAIGDELQDPLLGLPDVLPDISGDNVLEKLLIHVYVQCYSSCRTDAMWGRLDDVLSRSAFHSLHRVSLKIIVWILVHIVEHLLAM
ncbi:uncharacterized protein LACBIDRAFT_333178 [Laccaria bicolor S238N-H82]|uniref:Predicted protein n=1 Tax=Laccaria bicolor (strain S238N-H82 / ATCC MYA-4686) TaxID=486041 RepID=B0DV53_LACBS|nr:uncharacterized protein LACBIDRAFT_333178 [Laccaria bicolor S238N-H82]EDR01451.1 predicted protein [Laccaria bicolor S238N-H82]|eukprot:XP_001887803.1 predicted protein [Laccaria bicolor S238N-H82]